MARISKRACMGRHWSRLVYERRLQKGHTVDSLATKAGVSVNSIKNIERYEANTTVEVLERILNALDYDLEVVDAEIGNAAPLALVGR